MNHLERLEARELLAVNVVPFTQPAPFLEELEGKSPFALFAADLDGDGRSDLVTVTDSDSPILWFANEGQGNFGGGRALGASLGSIRNAQVTDLDSDGKPDIAAATADGLYWFPNLGGRTFAEPRAIASSLAAATLLEPFDADGDGDRDLAVRTYDGSSGQARYFWHENLAGDASGWAVHEILLNTPYPSPPSLLPADIDGDGDIDLLGATGANSKGLSWFANNGDGTFAAGLEVFGEDAGFDASAVDLDGDGDTDIVAAGHTGIYYLENRGGSFHTTVLSHAQGAYQIGAADLDNDGVRDVLVYTLNPFTLAWFRHEGAGAFGAMQLISGPFNSPNPISPVDVDGDGDLDLIFPVYSSSQILIQENRLGESATTLTPPPGARYLFGQKLEFTVYLGYNATVDVGGGRPSLPVQVGSRTVQAVFLDQPTPSTLRFSYTVTAADLDEDGIVIGSTLALNGGSITDPYGNPIAPAVPQVATPTVRIDGDSPLVDSILRAGGLLTEEATGDFLVTFNEAVVGLDIADFFLTTTGGLTGASVATVSGSGSTYRVTVNTGTGDGTIRLDVAANATITDLNGRPLAAGYSGGRVLTVRRDHALPYISDFNYIEYDHTDLGIGYVGGHWDLIVHTYEDFAADEAALWVAPGAQWTRPDSAAFDFLGVPVGQSVYRLPTNQDPDLLYLGVGDGGTVRGTFARYVEPDPRVPRVLGSWNHLRLVGLRGPDGGHFSVWESHDEGPLVWISSADGISDQDSMIFQSPAHVHLNWAFSKPGVYAVDFVASGYVDGDGNGLYDAVNDPYSESGVVTYYFAVATPNSAPTIVNPSAISSMVGESVAFTGANTISVSDPEQTSGPVEVTLTTTSGGLSLGVLDGLSFWAGDGTGDSTMTFRGTLTAINAALKSLRFTPEAGFIGEARVDLTVDDLGYFTPGRTNAQTASATIQLAVTRPPNRAPVFAPIVPQSVAEGATLSLLVTAIDPEGRTVRYSLVGDPIPGATLDPQAGRFTFLAGDGPASLRVTVRATDDESGTATHVFDIKITNVSPSMTLQAIAPATAGKPWAISGVVADPGREPLTATIDFGDGTGRRGLRVDSDGAYHVEHTYATPGQYLLTVSADDGDGGLGVQTRLIEVPSPGEVPPPEVTTMGPVAIQGGSLQRSRVGYVGLPFSAPVTIAPGAITLRSRRGQVIRHKLVTGTLGGRMLAVARFLGRGQAARGLPDGRYVLTIDGDQIRDSQGQAVDADGDGVAGGRRVVSFQRLIGDRNGDGQVNRQDRQLRASARAAHPFGVSPTRRIGPVGWSR